MKKFGLAFLALLLILWLFPSLAVREHRIIEWVRTSTDQRLEDCALVNFNNRIWAVGQREIWSSENGIDWECVKSFAEFCIPGRNNRPLAVAFNNKLWAIFGDGLKADVWSSADGKDWSLACEDIGVKFTVYSSLICVFKQKLWIAVKGESASLISSEDGIRWQRVAMTGPFPSELYGDGYRNFFVFNEQLWLQSKTNGLFWVSSDGVSWQSFKSGMYGAERYNAQYQVFQDKLWMVGGSRPYTFLETVIESPLFFLEILNMQGSSSNPKYLSDTWYSDDGKRWYCNSKKEALDFINHKLFVFNDKLCIIGGAGHFGRKSYVNTEEMKFWRANFIKP